MDYNVKMPDMLAFGIGQDAERVIRGAYNGWLSLPIDAQKVVREVKVEYHGSTSLPLPSDVFDIEVKLLLSVDGVLTERTASLRINDFRTDLSARVSTAVNAAVRSEIEALGHEYEPAMRLLL